MLRYVAVEKSQKIPSLVSPRMAMRVAKRAGQSARTRMNTANNPASERNLDERIEATNKLINFALDAVPIGVTFAAVEYPALAGYGRIPLEKSGCPILQAKHGHFGRFMVATCSLATTGRAIFSGVLYEDAVKSNQDVLVRSQFEGEIGSGMNQLRLPDVIRARDSETEADGVWQSSALTRINSLSELLVQSTVSPNTEVIASVTAQYDARVAQYQTFSLD